MRVPIWRGGTGRTGQLEPFDKKPEPDNCLQYGLRRVLTRCRRQSHAELPPMHGRCNMPSKHRFGRAGHFHLWSRCVSRARLPTGGLARLPNDDVDIAAERDDQAEQELKAIIAPTT